MQAKDILKSNAPGAVWAVTNSGWVRKSDKAIGRVQRQQCTPVKIIDPSNQYGLSPAYVYEDTVIKRDALGNYVTEWRVAPAEERSKGFLVEDGGGNRWVVKSADFIALWSEKEKEWSEKEREHEKEEQERVRRNTLQLQEDARIKAVNESIEKDIVRSLADLLGGGAPVTVNLGVEGKWNTDYTAYRATTSGRVTINVDDFQRLLEAVYEAREGVN